MLDRQHDLCVSLSLALSYSPLPPLTPTRAADNSTENMQTYGVAYTPSEQDGWGTGSITWEQGGEKMWRLSDKAMGPNAEAQIGQRLVTAEPMYIMCVARSFPFLFVLASLELD